MRTRQQNLEVSSIGTPGPDLEVANLSVGLRESSAAPVLDNVNFRVNRRSIVGILGESGSGKTVMSLAIMGMLFPELQLLSGSIKFMGKEIAGRENRRSLQQLRGTGITMIFQQPSDCLNPVMRVGTQIERLFRLHHGDGPAAARQQTNSILEHFGFQRPTEILKAYPHQLSGGMAQRVLLAMALACRPRLLIADEPTTGLDVTAASEALDLILMTVVESDASAVVISHDVGVVARVSDFVLVMHAGHIVERGPVKEVLTKPGHPYTRGLLASVPTVNEKRPIDGIPGQVPLIGSFPTGCRFSERCSFVMERCKERPPDYLVGDDHYSLCWLHEENR